VLSMLLRKGKITREFVRMMEGWRHSGFNVFSRRKDLSVSETVPGTSCRIPHPGLLLSRTYGVYARGGHGHLPVQRRQRAKDL
jgi:hypothetical protein